MNKYFENVNTLEELRKQYKELLKKYHPDNGEDVTVMQTVALFGNGKEIYSMDTLEVLTLVLVIFAALIYIDNYSNRK